MQKIIKGDCLEVMKTFPDNHFTSIITDPPYGLHFMGKGWDSRTPNIPIWQQAWRICKPGSILLAFGAPRTHHKLMDALECAGWEIRDVIMWLYGSGFPKSHNLSKAIDKSKGNEREFLKENPRHGGGNSKIIKGDYSPPITKPSSDLSKIFDGYGTALKPAYEPIIVCMKPLDGTFAQNAEKWGVAGLNIDACRIGTPENKRCAVTRSYKAGRLAGGLNGEGEIQLAPHDNKGRWPANLILDEEAAEELDEQTGYLAGAGNKIGTHRKQSSSFVPDQTQNNFKYDNGGGASRFLYCAKASSSERNKGLEGMPLKNPVRGEFALNKAGLQVSDTKIQRQNSHPTVKPIALMEYLIKLIMPPKDGLILDPFAGSGTTLIAAKKLGYAAIGIEKEEEYAEIAKARLNAFHVEAEQLEFF